MDQPPLRLTCGCQVTTSRDFLGRVVGTITVRATECTRDDHEPGRVVLMPGREHAGPTGGGPLHGA
jgi:hypothetical protein